jgi:hypothetical protein
MYTINPRKECTKRVITGVMLIMCKCTKSGILRRNIKLYLRSRKMGDQSTLEYQKCDYSMKF